MKHRIHFPVLISMIAAFFLLTGTLFAQGNAPQKGATSLTLLCGAAMKPPIEEAARAFQQQTGIQVECNYGASNLLLAQLKLTRQADLFMPADLVYMDQAREAKLVNDSRVVAYLVPVIMVRKGNPLKIKTLSDLAKPGVKLGMGNERTAAIGKIARSILKANNVSLEAIDKNTVYTCETVTELGVALKLKTIDATIAWTVTARYYPKDIDMVAIPVKQNTVIPVPIAPVNSSSKKKEALQFLNFLSSDKGKAIWKKHHYDLTDPTAGMRSLLIHCGNSMRPAAEVLAKEYTKRYGKQIDFNFGGTETLLPQIEVRREGDVFICHDPFGDLVKKIGLLGRATTVGYLEPVIVVPTGNPQKIGKLMDLLKPNLRVGVPDPRYATCGEMVEKNLQAKKAIKSFSDHRNFVVQMRSHADLATALLTGHIDAAVTWNFIAATYRDKMDMVPTGEKFPDTRVQVCVLRCAKDRVAAERFMALAASPFGQKVFKQYGYGKNAK